MPAEHVFPPAPVDLGQPMKAAEIGRFLGRNVEHPAPRRHRAVPQRQDDPSRRRKQGRDACHGAAPLVPVQVHPHRGKEEEVEPLSRSTDQAQVRQGVVQPLDARAGMDCPPPAAQLKGWLYCGDPVTAPGKGGSIAPGTRSHVEHRCGIGWEQVHHVAMHVLEGNALILLHQGSRVLAATA